MCQSASWHADWSSQGLNLQLIDHMLCLLSYSHTNLSGFLVSWSIHSLSRKVDSSGRSVFIAFRHSSKWLQVICTMSETSITGKQRAVRSVSLSFILQIVITIDQHSLIKDHWSVASGIAAITGVFGISFHSLLLNISHWMFFAFSLMGLFYYFA